MKIKKILDDLKKTTEVADDEFKTLKQQLKEARNDATLLAKEFGENSVQALDAAKRVAELTKKLDDFEKTTEVADDGFKSLKQQLKEARNDATLLAQKFGENSVQALGAAKRVAELTEEIDDFNQRVKALNPEAKFNAIQGALQGVFGGLQGVTGALQLFGEENKQVEEIARKLQGALNLAQGINSVLGLKD